MIDRKYVHEAILKSSHTKCVAVNNTEIPVIGRATVRASLDGMPIRISGLVTDVTGVHSILLGADWLRLKVPSGISTEAT